MRKYIPLLLILTLVLSSCSESKSIEKANREGVEFLSDHGVVVDSKRPYYNSTAIIPEIYDTVWEIRDILSRDVVGVSLEKYRGEPCRIYMYPVLKLPFSIKKNESIEARAVIISCKGKIVCSYIEFISELRTLPPMSLRGRTLVDMSGVNWDKWKYKIDDDGDKQLVIWQYYNALRMGNYEEAYSYIYDKNSIKKEDFIKAARENSLLYIDFLEISQYKNPSSDECYFLIKAKIGDSQGKFKNKIYEIIFDLKRDHKIKEYSGWKIYKTKIK